MPDFDPGNPARRARRRGLAGLRGLGTALLLLLAFTSLEAGPSRRVSLRPSPPVHPAVVSRTDSLRPDPAAVAALADDLRSLGATVDPAEAADLAAAAEETLRQLRLRYRMARGRLWHNLLVNLGLRQRGLCYHWADDLAVALRALGCRTLTIGRVVARPGSLREHHAVLLTVPGSPSGEGLILDGWRHSGRLFWIRRAADTAYPWQDTAD